MKSGGRRAFAGNDVVICLSDDDDGGVDVAAGSSGEDLPSDTTGVSAAAPAHTPPEQGEAVTDPAIANTAPSPSRSQAREIDSPGSVRPSSSAQGATSPGGASFTSMTGGRGASAAIHSPAGGTGGAAPCSSTTKPSAATAMGATEPSAGDANGSGASKEVEDPLVRQRNLARQRNSYVQTLLSTAGCVLVIDNLEVDVQPFDVLVQLMKFGNNKGKVHSVHIPPPYPELNRAIAYVVFLKKEYADVAAAFLTRNFVVSARGRPWIVSRCVQELNEERFGFPTLSAFKGEAQAQDGNGESFGGLKIISENQEAEYSAAKRRRVLFEQHRKQTQIMLQRHAQEEKYIEDNPDLSLYR